MICLRKHSKFFFLLQTPRTFALQIKVLSYLLNVDHVKTGATSDDNISGLSTFLSHLQLNKHPKLLQMAFEFLQKERQIVSSVKAKKKELLNDLYDILMSDKHSITATFAEIILNMETIEREIQKKNMEIDRIKAERDRTEGNQAETQDTGGEISISNGEAQSKETEISTGEEIKDLEIKKNELEEGYFEYLSFDPNSFCEIFFVIFALVKFCDLNLHCESFYVLHNEASITEIGG